MPTLAIVTADRFAMAMRLPLTAGLLLALVVTLPGCFLAAAALVGGAAAGAVSHSHNEAWMDFKETMPASWEATLRALRRLGHDLPEGLQPGPTEGKIESGDTLVFVDKHAGGYVRVRARVGTFDTEDNARRAALILEEVLQQMPRR